ncbi:branched-chain amino acid transport system II carrier protein [Treponema pedis]|uniref:Branched-chain amino acid transport system II carrier protein n=1 Tax=Treponema pedis str. T A4 TaxID=1291379 RepID=S6A7V0_9SPIR|nr:branched-chain amino acid transport system II carrier protein [Treponema pedis]AGT42719.1 branched-chain amino acid transport system II carrier protein [Treponema pedis str. T A4]
MNKKTGDVIVIGFALFAMFLGAGNLIFPPTLGHLAGTEWFFALLGFLVTGVGMPVLGIISMGKCGGSLSDFTKNINNVFGTFFIIFVMLIIGPLFAIPRTAATTYEIAVRPMNFGISSVTSSFIFFAITLFFVLTPNNVIDRVGKFLTPALILVLALLVIKGIITPIAGPASPSIDKIFLRGFKEGYQTMDALGSMILATIVISGITSKGYMEKKDLLKMTVYTGFLACLGLGLVYGGLVYVGATGSSVLPEQLSRTEIVVKSSELLWGNAGRVVLGLAIGLACLTTSIGLTATAGEYFANRFKDDISYRATVIIICVVSFFLSNFGVDNIIAIAGPILEVVYPVAIVLIILNLFIDYIPNRYFYSGAVIGTLCISILQGLVAAKELINNLLIKIGAVPSMNTEALSFNTTIRVLKHLPFEGIGFPWLLPAIGMSLLFGFGYILSEITKKAPSMKNK